MLTGVYTCVGLTETGELLTEAPGSAGSEIPSAQPCLLLSRSYCCVCVAQFYLPDCYATAVSNSGGRPRVAVNTGSLGPNCHGRQLLVCSLCVRQVHEVLQKVD